MVAKDQVKKFFPISITKGEATRGEEETAQSIVKQISE